MQHSAQSDTTMGQHSGFAGCARHPVRCVSVTEGAARYLSQLYIRRIMVACKFDGMRKASRLTARFEKTDPRATRLQAASCNRTMSYLFHLRHATARKRRAPTCPVADRL